VRFAARNTGISLLLYNNTAVSSSKIKIHTNKKEKKIVTSGHTYALQLHFSLLPHAFRSSHIMASEETINTTVENINNEQPE